MYCAEKGGYLSIALAVGLALNVTLNLLLVPTWGLQGGVLATVISNAISLTLVFYFSRRFGMHISHGTMIACGLPLCCFFEPLVGLTVLLILLLLLWKGKLLLSRSEVQAIELALAGVTNRLRQRMAGSAS